jgi:ElaB/YqjD/DUF883 family membrane-anchored ribosome-binding protein
MHNPDHAAREIASGISHEFKSFLSDVEDLVKQATTLTGEDLAQAKAKLSARIGAAKESVSDAGAAISDRARSAAHITNEYVHEQPWKSISIGAAFGLLLGFVLARRV